MTNVKHHFDDATKLLTVVVDLSKEFGPSKSGKTITVASSRGNKRIEGTDCFLGLNIYKYPETEE